MTELTRSQRISDAVTTFCGSWTFVLGSVVFTTGWIIWNSWLIQSHRFDQYPYILLNLIVTLVELVQAPLIMMSQNRQAERDREHWQQMSIDLTEIKQLLKGKE